MMASNETKWNTIIVENESHKMRFMVTIKNFLDHICKPGDVLETLQMECTQRCGAKWAFEVFAHGQNEEDKQNIGVFLKLVEKPSHAGYVTATYEIYIVGKSGRKIQMKNSTCNGVEEDLMDGLGFDSLKRNDVKKNPDLYLPNGHLTICCEGKEFLNKPKQTLSIKTRSQNEKLNRYSDRVKKMYQEGICSDVILKSGSDEFKCHKAILAVNSNYFKAMFEHDMKENRENVVDLSQDLNGEELKGVLDFIYLGILPTLNTYSLQTLIRVSDMYEISGLQDASESLLKRKLNSKNALELLIFSDQFKAKRLKKAAASFIANSSP